MTAGIIQSFGPSAEGLFTYLAEEVIGKKVSILMPSPHRERHDSYIQRYLTTGERRITGVERVLDTMEKAGAQAQCAGEIIRHLRQFVEKRETERNNEGINKVVEEASALALIGAKSSGVIIHTKLSSNIPVVFVDKVQIQQVIVNLIRNAVDAMAQSPRKILTVATRSDGGRVLVTVTDTGLVLSPSVVDKLFKPFVTTKEKGMGIGLSICRQIVETQGGCIEVETPEAGGARFLFTLPFAAPRTQMPPGKR